MSLETRDPRRLLSKSFMQTSCGEKAWLSIFQPLPWVPNEAMLFGSAVDAGCTVIMACKRAGIPVDMDRALEAANAVMFDAPIPIDALGVQAAIEAFDHTVPFDFTLAKLGTAAGTGTAFTIRLELPGVGAVEAHPDMVLRDHSIYDIKTSKRAKPADAAEKSTSELGFYAVCYEALTGERVPEVGYLTWCRTSKPTWQLVTAPVTDEMREASLEEARTWAGAIRLASPERNFTFPFGPKYGCQSCQYHPSLGGPCRKAERLTDAAA